MGNKSGILYIPAWMETLPEVNRQTTVADIATALDLTYSHMHKVLRKMEEEGWVVSKKIGRIRNYNLTEKGRKIKNAVVKVKVARK